MIEGGEKGREVGRELGRKDGRKEWGGGLGRGDGKKGRNGWGRWGREGLRETEGESWVEGVGKSDLGYDERDWEKLREGVG